MSETRERIESDAKTALKAGDKVRVSTLRMLSSELTNRRIELGRALEEPDVLEVLAKAEKRRREAEDQFRTVGREDLADKEAAEAAIVREYLPEPLSDDAIEALIDRAIAETGATGPKQMGAVMGRLVPEVRGRVDGGDLSRRVKARLQG